MKKLRNLRAKIENQLKKLLGKQSTFRGIFSVTIFVISMPLASIKIYYINCEMRHRYKRRIKSQNYLFTHKNPKIFPKIIHNNASKMSILIWND